MSRLCKLFAVALAIALAGCVTNSELTIFTYDAHDLPRVSVIHSPVQPNVGELITFFVQAEVEADTTVDSIGVQRMNANNEMVGDLECNSQGLRANCSVEIDSSGSFFYRAVLRYNNGKRAYSPATYEFFIGRRNADDPTPVPLRVPLKPTDEISDGYRIDLLLVRDATGGYPTENFLSDAARVINQGVLADPIYRWRDDQLAFFATNQIGRTSSFYDGRDTACGQNPWPSSDQLPSAFAEMEVLGVLHRQTGSSAIGTALTVADFRDCAGQFVDNPAIGTFSAKMGLFKSPQIAKHEFGHAAFGLGDEYNESQSTRNVSPVLGLGSDNCCCLCDQAGAVIGGDPEGGVTTSSCTTAGFNDVLCVAGALPVSSTNLPVCEDNFVADDAWVPLACLADGQGRCPPIESRCVLDSAWLGSPPPTITYERPNVFPDQASCELARTAAAAHPGVEAEDDRLGACRQLCGTSSNPCPCGTREAWVTDAIAGIEPKPIEDAMASLDLITPLHGGTCAWCVETSLCVRWQSAHEDEFSPEEVWQTCETPPKWIRHFNDLLEYLGSL